MRKCRQENVRHLSSELVWRVASVMFVVYVTGVCIRVSDPLSGCNVYSCHCLWAYCHWLTLLTPKLNIESLTELQLRLKQTLPFNCFQNF